MKLRDFLIPRRSDDGAYNAGPGKAIVQSHFNRVARHYDLANTIMSLGMHHAWKRRAVELLSPQQGERLGDICGGTADLALLAQQRRGPGRDAPILVYDLNWAMLEKGRAKAGSSNCGRGLAFVRGDALELALRSNSLDAVMVGFGVRNFVDLKWGLEEMVRVLRPGGRLVCLEFSRPPARWLSMLYDFYSMLMMPLVGRVFTGSWHTYDHLAGTIRSFPTPEQLARMLERAGLGQVRWQSLSAGIAAIYLGIKP